MTRSYGRDVFKQIGDCMGGGGDATSFSLLSEGIPLRDGKCSVNQPVSFVGDTRAREGVFMVSKPIPSKFDLDQAEKQYERKNTGMDYVSWIHPPPTASLTDRFGRLQAELFRKSREANSKKAPLGTNRKVRQAIATAAAASGVPPPPSRTARSLNQKVRRKYANPVKKDAVLRITYDPNKPKSTDEKDSKETAAGEADNVDAQRLLGQDGANDVGQLSGEEESGSRAEVESPLGSSEGSHGEEKGEIYSAGTSDEENRNPGGGSGDSQQVVISDKLQQQTGIDQVEAPSLLQS